MMQSIGVMQVGAAPALGQGECPKFILDTGATENAAGVNTLQQLLQWGVVFAFGTWTSRTDLFSDSATASPSRRPARWCLAARAWALFCSMS